MIGAYIMLGYFGLRTIDRIGITNTNNEIFISEIFKLVQIDTVNLVLNLRLHYVV